MQLSAAPYSKDFLPRISGNRASSGSQRPEEAESPANWISFEAHMDQELRKRSPSTVGRASIELHEILANTLMAFPATSVHRSPLWTAMSQAENPRHSLGREERGMTSPGSDRVEKGLPREDRDIRGSRESRDLSLQRSEFRDRARGNDSSRGGKARDESARIEERREEARETRRDEDAEDKAKAADTQEKSPSTRAEEGKGKESDAASSPKESAAPSESPPPGDPEDDPSAAARSPHASLLEECAAASDSSEPSVEVKASDPPAGRMSQSTISATMENLPDMSSAAHAPKGSSGTPAASVVQAAAGLPDNPSAGNGESAPQTPLAGAAASGTNETAATEAPSSAGAPLRSAASPVPEQVLMALKQALKNGQNQLQLRLDPPELGHVRLHLSIDGNRMKVVLEVNAETTREVLQEAVPQLRQILQDDQIGLDEFEVRYVHPDGQFGGDSKRDESEDPDGDGSRGEESPDPDVLGPIVSDEFPGIRPDREVNLVA
jgi:flagellar hook-length control protein FliK